MAYQPYPRAMDPAALKWRDLAERRRAHFVDLYLSGRWKHYYTNESFIAAFRQSVEIAARWAQIAPRPTDPQPPAA